METAVRLTLGDDGVDAWAEFNPLTGSKIKDLGREWIYPAKHFITEQDERERAVRAIDEELKDRVSFLTSRNKLVEAQRLEQRTKYDMEMLRELGFCHGIENYSRHLTGRRPGEPPPTLMDYLPKDALIIIDESHVAVPQIGGMYYGDRSRKETLVECGFRLPSAFDNRPLTFEEFTALAGQTVYVSATPAAHELRLAGDAMAEQII